MNNDKPTAVVIGAGVSGMTAAHALSHRFDVTVFEARNHLGGTRTHAMSPQGSLDVSWATAVKVPSTGSRSSPRSATGVSRMCAWSSAMD